MHTSRRCLVALALAALGGSALPAQQQQPYPVGKIWVDPNTGVDTNPGTEFSPVQTITKALTLCNPIPAGFTDMVIMIRPGVYNSNFETFPLLMTKNTSLQGAGALNTVIKGDSFSGQVLIKFEANVQNEFNRSFIDGLDIREGDINIRIENNATHTFASRPLISNCFICDAALWGIDIVSAPGGSATDDLDCTPPILLPQTHWIVHRPKIVNCTFRNNRHAIMNRTNVFPLNNDDPPVLGVSEPGLMNLLVTDSFVQGLGPKDDFLGIDKKDLEIHDGTLVIPTSCAFDSANVNGLFDPLLNPNCLPGVSTAGSPPLFLFRPVDVVTAGTPMFVEDVAGNPVPVANAADIRLNPALAGVSPSPIDTGFLPSGDTVTWANGTVGNLQLSRNGFTYADVRDVDCEGYGNPRVVGLIDLGADELGQLVVAGYTRFTTDFRNGDTIFRWLGPAYAGTATQFDLATIISGGFVQFFDANSFPYLLRPANTVAPYNVAGLSGQGFFSGGQHTAQNLSGIEPVTTLNAAPPVLVQVNEQWVLDGLSLITNLQSFTL